MPKKYTKKIKNGKTYFFYRLHHKNLNHPRDIYAPTATGLDKKIRLLENELDNNIISDRTLFISFFQHWLFEIHFLDKKASTKEKYEGIYRNYINTTYFSKIKLKNLNLDLIQNFYNDLYKNKTSISTIHSIHKLLSPAIRYAFNNNKIIKDFSSSLILPKETSLKNKSVNPFTLEEQFAFLNSLKNNSLEILFITALSTGLRQGELFALTWNDIDFISNTIHVNKSVKEIANVSIEGRDKMQTLVQPTKTEKSNRYVPMPKFLSVKLLDHKEQQKIYELTSNIPYADANLVFCNSFGKYLNASNVRKRFNRILEKNNIRKIKFHDLRHTYATRLFEAGEEPKVIQELLGHNNISITLDTYTHVLDKLKAKTVSKLDDLYSNFNL